DRSSFVMSDDGTDVGLQTAMATGIAYYHRAGHWREPPNLFNPFWRAGLTHPDIDAQGQGSDIPNALDSSHVPWAADAYSQLKAVGYKGFQ
ncbi:MAG TPA: pilus assembly protein, partial [Myxococcaceae bacterium]|nr:pilus assembly protein [Myxococcaceae bacterium]